VIYNNPIADFKPSASWTSIDNLSCRLVTGNNALVAFRPLAEMLVVDAPNVRAANGRRFDAKKNLAISR
jgi:hypothetical protein